MGFNRRKMEDQRREAVVKEAANRRANDAQVLRTPLIRGPMTDEQKSKFAALQSAWLAVREKRRRAEMVELDAAIMEFLQLHRAETDTVVLQAL